MFIVNNCAILLPAQLSYTPSQGLLGLRLRACCQTILALAKCAKRIEAIAMAKTSDRTSGAADAAHNNMRCRAQDDIPPPARAASIVRQARSPRRRGEAEDWGKLAGKPGSVSGIQPPDSHSSRPVVARRLKRPTRRQREPRYRRPI